jgi:hypothetical protein
MSDYTGDTHDIYTQLPGLGQKVAYPPLSCVTFPFSGTIYLLSSPFFPLPVYFLGVKTPKTNGKPVELFYTGKNASGYLKTKRLQVLCSGYDTYIVSDFQQICVTKV